MKNYFLPLTFSLFAFAAVAQPEKGQYMLNLAGRYHFGKSDYYARQHRFITHLGVGYFVTKRLAIGVQAETERSLTEYKNPGAGTQYVNENSYQKNRMGAMARYYFPMGKKTAFFVHGNAGFKQESSKHKFVDQNFPDYGTYRRNYPNDLFVSVTPGFAWFPTRRIAVEATALTSGYTHQLNNTQYRPRRKFEFMDGLNPKLGVTILLGGKPKQAPVQEQ